MNQGTGTVTGSTNKEVTMLQCRLLYAVISRSYCNKESVNIRHAVEDRVVEGLIGAAVAAWTGTRIIANQTGCS